MAARLNAHDIAFTIHEHVAARTVADAVERLPFSQEAYLKTVAFRLKAGLFEDSHSATLLNPIVVVEVLSPSTEAHDRGEKFAHYRRLESLQEYVHVPQDRVRVERYVRQSEQWVTSELAAPDDILAIAVLNCRVTLADSYEKVALSADAPEM